MSGIPSRRTRTGGARRFIFTSISASNVLSHFFGEPQETRHLFLHNEDVALSPNWSMHFGVGTSNYKFIWGMAGENQVFDDMDQSSRWICGEKFMEHRIQHSTPNTRQWRNDSLDVRR